MGTGNMKRERGRGREQNEEGARGQTPWARKGVRAILASQGWHQ